MTLSIVNIDANGPDPSFDLLDTGGGLTISNQQSNKPLKSNGQSALNDALANELGQALADYINERWDNYYYMNGQSFKVCADFAGTVDAQSGGSATADVDIGNVDVSPL
jgi:hypothetical protein